MYRIGCKIIGCLVILLITLPGLCALPPFLVRHYDIKDGLSDNMVVCMHQDRRGMMWFGTFDGLNRFDGYAFTPYKMIQNGEGRLNNNRIDRIEEDGYGHLWLQTYNGKLNSFNPHTEKFFCILPEDESRVKDFQVFDTTGIWVSTFSSGCVFIRPTISGNDVRISHIDRRSGHLPSDTVNRIYRASDGKAWILTAKGLVRYEEQTGESQLCRIPSETPFHSFISVAEGNNELVFGTEDGSIWKFDKLSQKFGIIQTPDSAAILAIKALDKGEWLILSGDNRILLCDAAFERLKDYNHKQYPDLIFQKKAPMIYTDKYGEVWIELQGSAVGHYSPQSQRLAVYTVQSDKNLPYVLPNFQIFEDGNNNLWLHPACGGLSFYNRESRRLERFVSPRTEGIPPFSDVLHSGLVDRQGNLWICTYSRGIEEIIFSHSRFHRELLKVEPDYFDNEVRSLYEDSGGVIWIGNKAGEVRLQDSDGRILGKLDEGGRITPVGKWGSNVYAIFEDSKGRMWLGTKGDGLYCLKRVEGQLAFHITRYVYRPSDAYSLPNNNVYTIYEDRYGKIWIGTYGGGLCLLDESLGQPRFLSNRNDLIHYPKTNANVRYVVADHRDNLWIGTTHGLVVAELENEFAPDMPFRMMVAENDTSVHFRAYDIHYILPAQDGCIYFATFGGGLHCLQKGWNYGQKPQFISRSSQNGFPSDILLNLLEDEKGILWMSTESGLIKFDTHTGLAEKYDRNNGLDCAFFSEASILKSSSGEIMVGSSDGYFHFLPDEVKKSEYVPPLVFSRFLLFNRKVEPGTKDSILSVIADYTGQITLSSEQSVFSVEYAALDYVNTGNIRYAYRLKGFEKEWNEVGTQRNATYTNLIPGDYVFEVKSTNSDGVWTDNVRNLKITVLPTFWQSSVGMWLAVFLLVSLVAGISFWLIMFYRMKDRVKLEHRLTDMKLRFFTDISHELRTPLTLIASPVDYLLRMQEVGGPVKEQLQIVHRNTERMLRLVNQILDFRKIQNKKMRLRIEQFSLGEFVDGVCNNFREAARERSILLEVNDSSAGQLVWADREKVESILFNLLSNAFKFTPKGRAIRVNVKDENDFLMLEVEDEGTGMNREQLKGLFVRFNSVEPAEKTFQQGTGIGLSLVRELVEIHHGEIQVESEPGKGSCFRVNFRKGTAHYKASEDFIVSDRSSPFVEPAGGQEMEEVAENPQEPLILIAEDNIEVRQFLKIILSPSYRVMEAEDGVDAWQLVQQHLPDVLISDIMMPGMDGIELTRKIREDIRTSHLQVVLLTACTTEENKIEGVKCGADDYITKPFNATYLEARIKNLLEQRKNLQEYYCSFLNPGRLTLSKPEVKSSDETLMDKLMTFMEENMDNSELSVEDLVMVAAIGRSTLFKKLKSLTGMAPVEFIREVRIRRAAQLIESGEYNISEVSYRVGINEPRYFSRCFKKHFGMTPSEYKNKQPSIKNDIES